MYKIDKDNNRILPLKKELFTDLGFEERKHLQEWIAKEPSMFGEDLLIIQKELSGFDGTRERLDLLALDKEGNLVVIENKLDDSGRDVVWQALKYASYCSTLKKSKIIEIFQNYLDETSPGGASEDIILDFLEESDLESVVLNSGVGPRIIFVAAKYGIEVTSTVLWLLDYDLRIQCFKATPYSMDGESNKDLLLKFDQIIPTPEESEFKSGMSEKNAEERDDARKSETKRHTLRREFWSQALEDMKKDSKFSLYDRVSPGTSSELNAGSGLDVCPFRLVFTMNGQRIGFVIARADKDENKDVFDRLEKSKEEIEKAFGENLDWERSDKKISSFIWYRGNFDGKNKDNWPKIIKWMTEKMSKFESALRPFIDEARKTTKRENARRG